MKFLMHRLAERLGKSVREIGELPSDELTDWLAYDRIATSDAWHQTAMICSVIANAHSDGKRQYKPADFLPKKHNSKRMSNEEMGAKLGMFVRVHNGRIANNPDLGG